ncbi:cytochrome c1 [Bombella apis]|uniref:cytochrome c1 n=1 Tax=Bombella apis TaxID=1785988 RepID=UPI0023F22429|nr:cytochrome c1 [Bombella apis]MCT6819704.1 cytochrome c1 [Bombella apis]MCT6845251.1 cytochrome c1 [Bombella apis]
MMRSCLRPTGMVFLAALSLAHLPATARADDPAPTQAPAAAQVAAPAAVPPTTMRPEERGLMIFQQVCSSCHSMERAHYGDMIDLQPSVTALQHWAQQRHAGLESPIASPYPSVAVGKANNGGDYPPDLSHIVRTIRGGPDYIRQMLAGYRPVPPGVTLAPNTYYNPIALTHHHRFKMRPPLHEGMIAFPDGTQATIPQMASDVTAFLQWADDSHRSTRHFIGTAVLLYLALLGGILLALWRLLKKEA